MIALSLPDAETVAALRAQYDESGRCSIQPLLTPGSAEALTAFLESFDGWARIRGLRGQRFDCPALRDGGIDPATDPDQQALDRMVAENAAGAFAFRYDAIPMTEAQLAAGGPAPLAELRRVLSDPALTEILRTITGEPRFTGLEVQATRYRHGDFLTLHHDGPNADRKVAMVLGLSRDWSADWGGSLLFPGADDRLEGLSPGFNRLDLFAVPQFHFVSHVSPAAPRARIAVSGWYTDS